MYSMIHCRSVSLPPQSSSSSLSSGECGPLVEGLVLQLVETSQQETTPTRDLWAEERPLDQQVRSQFQAILKFMYMYFC